MQCFQVTTDLLNSGNLKIAIAQLFYELQVCNFDYVIDDSKVHENILKQNSLNAKVFKLQAIYSTVISSK